MPGKGKFVVQKGSTGKFRFSLLSSNGQVVATSQTYATKASCMNGIKAVRTLSGDAEVEDQTTKEWATAEADRKAAAKAKKAGGKKAAAKKSAAKKTASSGAGSGGAG